MSLADSIAELVPQATGDTRDLAAIIDEYLPQSNFGKGGQFGGTGGGGSWDAGLVEYPAEFAKSIPAGGLEFVGSAMSGAAQNLRDVASFAGMDPDVLEIVRMAGIPSPKDFIESGEAVKGLAESIPVTPGFEDSWTRKFGKGIGTAIAGGAAYGLGGPLALAGVGGSSAYDSTRQMVKDMGGTDEQASNYAGLSAAVTAATEPFGAIAKGFKIFKRLDKATGGEFVKYTAKQAAKDIAGAGGAEFGQEFLQGTPDETARHAFDEERTLVDSLASLFEQGIVGGVVGLLFGGTASAIKAKVNAADRRLYENYQQRVEAGQADPVPSKDDFKAAGFKDGGGNRTQRRENIAEIGQRLAEGEAEIVPGQTGVPPGSVYVTGQNVVPTVEGEPNAGQNEAIQGQGQEVRPAQEGQAQGPQGEVNAVLAPAQGLATGQGVSVQRLQAESVAAQDVVKTKRRGLNPVRVAEKELADIASKHGEMVLPENPPQMNAMEQSGYTFKDTPEGRALVREIRDQLPPGVKWTSKVRVVSKDKDFAAWSRANGSDVASEIGTEAMAEAIRRDAGSRGRAKFHTIAANILNQPEVFPVGSAEWYSARKWQLASEMKGDKSGIESIGSQPPEFVEVANLKEGDQLKIAGETYKVGPINPESDTVRLEDGLSIEASLGNPLAIDKGSYKAGKATSPDTTKRPGLFDQETFDSFSGKQGELPMAPRAESNLPDVPGQLTMTPDAPVSRTQAAKQNAQSAWAKLEDKRNKQTLFSTGIDPENIKLFIDAIRAELAYRKYQFADFIADVKQRIGEAFVGRHQDQLKEIWKEATSETGRTPARPDLAKMGTTPEVRHLEDLGDIARNRMGVPGVRKDADLLAEAKAELAENYDTLKEHALSGELFEKIADSDKAMVQAVEIFKETVKTAYATNSEAMKLDAMTMQDHVRRSRREAAKFMRIGADRFMGPQERASFEAHNQLMALPASEEALIDKMLARRAKLVESRKKVVERASAKPSAVSTSRKTTKSANVKQARERLDKSIRELGALLQTPFTGGPFNPAIYKAIGVAVRNAVETGIAYADLAGVMIREFGEVKYAKIESVVQDAWNKATAGIPAEPLTGMQKQIEAALRPSPEIQATPAALSQRSLKFVSDIDAKIVAIDKAIEARRRKWIKKNSELAAELKRSGFNVDAVLDGTADMRLAASVIREFNAGKSSYWDKQYELWVNSIFGWGTQVANISGTLYNTLKRGYVDRFVKATVDTAMRAAGLRKGGARYQELYHFTYGLVISWAKARQNFAMTWHTEQPRFNLEHGHPETTQFEYRKAAISAKYHGPKIRVMTRLMMAADDAAKTLAYSGQLSALAYRQASSDGLVDEQRLSRMLDLLADPHWEGREQAFDNALDWAFQEESKVGGAITKAVRKIPGGRYKWPFMNTITNIFKTGIRDTPFGIPEFLHQIAQAKKTGDWSKVDDGFARQIVGLGTMLAIALGMDWADEWITGTRDKNRPMKWRVPFTNTWLSYARLEPFATSMALMVDTIEDFKRAPGIGNKILSPIGSLLRQVDSKWFLAGSHDVIKGLEMAFRGDPQFWVPTAEWAVKLPASFIPNWLIRGPVSAAKGDVPVRRSYGKGTERLKSLVKTGLRATEVYGLLSDEYPKRDLWGKAIQKDGSPLPSSDWLARMMSMPTASKYKESPGDRMLYAWNERNPENPIRFGVAKRTYVADGKTYYMTDQQYDHFLRESGELSTKKLIEYIRDGKVDINSPTESNMKRMRKIVTESRASSRKAIKSDASGEQEDEE